MSNLTDFPQLSSIDKQLKDVTTRYADQKRELKQTDRYADNETERAYLLEELTDKYNQEYDELVDKYNFEYKVLKAQTAQDAFNAQEIDAEFADIVQTQLAVTNSPVDTINLLAAKLNAPNTTDAQKLAIAKSLPKLEADALGKAANNQVKTDVNAALKRVKSALEGVGMSHTDKFKQIEALETSYRPTMHRNQHQLLHKK